MKLSALVLLVCSMLTGARVIGQEVVEPCAGHACDGFQTISSAHHGCTIPNPGSACLDTSTAVSAVKTVIPDLTVPAYGYSWVDMDGRSYLDYQTVNIDVFSVSFYNPNTITIIAAFNHNLDTSPHRVKLRDILLSYWQYRVGRKVEDLEVLVYDDAVEPNMRRMLPEIYSLMGRDMAYDKQTMAAFQVRPRVGGNEQVAYAKLLAGCPFAAGAKKMLAEYAEFADRRLGSFEFRWTDVDSFNFGVYFYKS